MTSVYSKRKQKERFKQIKNVGGIEEEVNGRADGRKMKGDGRGGK